MIRLLSVFVLMGFITGCSIFKSVDDYDLSDIGSLNIRKAPPQDLEVNHAEVIRLYQEYLKTSEDPELRVRVNHRLAGLKLQWDEIREEQGIAADDQILAEDLELAAASIKDYETLLEQYPNRSDNDMIYYQLAKANQMTGNIDASIVALQGLVANYPGSKLYQETQFRLGRLLFSTGDYEGAEKSFSEVIGNADKGEPYYLDAQYLRGWSIFKQERYEQSLSAFTEVIDEHFPNEVALESARDAEAEILSDSLRIMAVMFDYIGDWTDISRFYAENGNRYYEYRLYAELSNYYFDKKYYTDSASSLLEFTKQYPDDDKAPLFYRRVIAGYEDAGYPDLERDHKKIFIVKYGVGSDYWNTHGEEPRSLITVALSEYILDLANYYHGIGQLATNAQEKEAAMNEASSWYQEYIRNFPKAPDAVEAQFLLAELNFELENYDEARNNYEIVAYQYPFHEKAAEAGYAALIAYSKYMPTDPVEALRWRQLNVASAQRFVLEFPNDPRKGTVLVNTAETLLADEYYEQALSTSRLAQQTGVELEPRYAYGAALVQGHSAFELNEFAEAEDALLRASEYENLDDAQRKELREKVAASIYKQGESIAETDPQAAVSQWLRIADVVPESPLRINAEYDAATLLMNNNELDQAKTVLLNFRENYPDSELAADIPDKLIVVYEGQEDFEQAAIELQGIVANSTDEEEKRVALFQSAEYFAKAENIDQAIVSYTRYAESYSTPFDPAVEAHFRLDELYAKQGNESERRVWLQRVIDLNNGAGEQATERSRFLAANASFELAEFDRVNYESIAITLPLSDSIVAKNNAMQGALTQYTQALDLEVLEFTTPSTYHIGEMYAQFSRALLDSERPEGLDELAAEEYQFLLEDQAFPLEEAAIQIHQTNVARTYDNIYDEWVKKSFKSMAELMPGQYDKPEKTVNYVSKIR
ncbi:MAG: tetratricopeptide repeat protein [Oleibacter sp.]|nr:tetratricopeptide repeat protein [Thalassolituus sp.]